MPTDWNALAKLGEAAFKRDTAGAVIVRRKPKPPEAVPTLAHISVMFPDDPLCPEWRALVAWVRTAPVEAFVILPHRGPRQNGKGLIYTSNAALQQAILAEIDDAGLAVVVGLIYELRTLRERWEKQCGS